MTKDSQRIALIHVRGCFSKVIIAPGFYNNKEAL
jgi:hypothetical protein